jgi:hypothetical protein
MLLNPVSSLRFFTGFCFILFKSDKQFLNLARKASWAAWQNTLSRAFSKKIFLQWVHLYKRGRSLYLHSPSLRRSDSDESNFEGKSFMRMIHLFEKKDLQGGETI